MRRLGLVLTVLLGACDLDVVVGRNFASDDGGDQTDAGAASDGGVGDGGVGDGGVGDGGVSDGGVSDGGADDGGMSDGGLSDAGSADAGDVDAGSPDSGAPDAGPANLRLSLSGPWVVQVSDTGTFTATVFNDGGQSADAGLVTLSFPTGITFLSGSGCTGGGLMGSCSVGTVQAFSAVSGQVTLHVDAGQGWHDLNAARGVETAVLPVAVTGVGALVVPVVAPRFVDITACFGTNITSYSVCTPASLVPGRIALLVDGGIDTILDGGAAGYYGVWGQSAHQRNIGMRFFAAGTGNVGTGYVGAAVDAGCFEGVIDNPMGVAFSGAWRGCMP